jgi:hypothetical protein
MTPELEETVNASPTKDFFIRMLVKDIELTSAIIDLVDNCVDGALRTRPNRNYIGLWVRLEVSPTEFRIVDNCGGISVDMAAKYAFRFGRPEEMQSTPHSVGQFGVGMKRALFKIGSKFRIESTTESSRFVLEEDVNEWKAKKLWKFQFKEVNRTLQAVPEDERGTKIEIKGLHDSVASDFKSDTFIKKLGLEIRQAHQTFLNCGLAITLNKIPIGSQQLKLFSSNELKPAFFETKFKQNGCWVDVKIYAGISESDPLAAGWYIYCNGRMIIGYDRTLTTGWGEREGETVPRYHNQFAMFRGFVFFDSDEACLLPWNTTKTGIDADSQVYRAIRLHMLTLMRPVIDFLNLYDAETRQEPQPLHDTVRKATLASVTDVQPSNRFQYPKPLPMPAPSLTNRISYNKPLEKIEKVMVALRTKSLKEVGEKTFDYFYERECEG